MANYPNSAPSFSNKSAGQTIASAHINAIQDEVVAIGGGLLNGTAPLNSSNSTLAHVSAGNSTITNLTLTSCTASGNITTAGSFLGTHQGSLNANSTALVAINVVTSSSVGAAGASAALPATPAFYWKWNLNGTTFYVPCYLST